MKQIKIDPRIVKHVGRDLITSSEVAVIELVKNSIDAKAKHISLRLYNVFPYQNLIPKDILSSIPKDYLEQPVFIIDDDGLGMSERTIDEGFLTVATAIKSLTENSLGEKGIGRLATQRLGQALLVETSSDLENHTSYVFIDWNNVINGINMVPSFECENTPHHTRLFIFGADLEDYVDNAMQLNQISLAEYQHFIQINRDLKSAINFLISPFVSKNENNNIPEIKFYYNEKDIDISFPSDILALAESIHSFNFNASELDILNCNLYIKPWYIERIHRALVKADAFNRLKKDHKFYSELLLKNSDRINNVLSKVLDKDSLLSLFKQILEDLYITTEDPNKKEFYDSFIEEKATIFISELSKITPISGSIFSFKQGTAIGDRIIIDSAFALNKTEKRYSLKELKYFLEDYNGVKLYRGMYRIGFLGNKESDWIKLQQFRTKGQQWYRFDLGNTVGHVSLSDASQKNIQEISSRLDISSNTTSEAFKMLINVVFNYLFYDLNRKANALIKIILNEEGLLEENLSKRVKKNDKAFREMMTRNKRMQDTISDISENLKHLEPISNTDKYILPKKSYDYLSDKLNQLTSDIKTDYTTQEATAKLLSEADSQLKAIEIESYNNYKLMANGLITETITHELHSLSKNGVIPDSEIHFDYLKRYFLDAKNIREYNRHVIPIQNSYDIISDKLNEVGNLYSFLENTFIKKGSYDEFTHQNIQSLILNIYKKFSPEVKNISIVCKTNDLSWLVPKGVLLHVFYNLISNSLYWIDIRRKWAQNDLKYEFAGPDTIVIEEYGQDGLIFYDTGTGISKSMEDILFEPLQSGKPLSEGRGMGLYIVRKLLNSFGGEIELLEERNKYGNRFKFLLMNNTSEEL